MTENEITINCKAKFLSQEELIPFLKGKHSSRKRNKCNSHIAELPFAYCMATIHILQKRAMQNSTCRYKNSIFRLEMYIFKLNMYISRLNICIFRLKIENCIRNHGFLSESFITILTDWAKQKADAYPGFTGISIRLIFYQISMP